MGRIQYDAIWKNLKTESSIAKATALSSICPSLIPNRWSGTCSKTKQRERDRKREKNSKQTQNKDTTENWGETGHQIGSRIFVAEENKNNFALEKRTRKRPRSDDREIDKTKCALLIVRARFFLFIFFYLIFFKKRFALGSILEMKFFFLSEVPFLPFFLKKIKANQRAIYNREVTTTPT